MVLGRLTHYALDIVFFSTVLAGVKRHTGMQSVGFASLFAAALVYGQRAGVVADCDSGGRSSTLSPGPLITPLSTRWAATGLVSPLA